mmetsp:Transcript_102262/g.266755  ORF Transcript_102262/g.266755 Transcript_102262/m.266755 type:complete len:210 (+) Transcript_102262:1012-1641(+)
MDQLHDHDRLADARTTEETNLASLRVRREQVDDLNACQQLLSRGVHLREGRRGAVDGIGLLRANRAQLIDGLPDNVDDAAERLLTHRHLDGRTRVQHLLAASEAVGPVHGNGAHHVLTQVLGHLQHQAMLEALHLQRVQDGRQGALELHVHDGTDDLRDLTRNGLLREASALDAARQRSDGRRCALQRRGLLRQCGARRNIETSETLHG